MVVVTLTSPIRPLFVIRLCNGVALRSQRINSMPFARPIIKNYMSKISRFSIMPKWMLDSKRPIFNINVVNVMLIQQGAGSLTHWCTPLWYHINILSTSFWASKFLTQLGVVASYGYIHFLSTLTEVMTWTFWPLTGKGVILKVCCAKLSWVVSELCLQASAQKTSSLWSVMLSHLSCMGFIWITHLINAVDSSQVGHITGHPPWIVHKRPSGDTYIFT